MPKTRRLSDASLVRRSQQGDRRAFGALVNRYDRRLRGLAFALLLDAGQMDEAMGMAYLRAWRDVVRLQPRDDVGPWLYRAVYNACIDQLRRAEAPTGVASDDGLLGALAGLAPADRVAVVLVEREAFTVGSAARILGVGVDVIETRLDLAREHLPPFVPEPKPEPEPETAAPEPAEAGAEAARGGEPAGANGQDGDGAEATEMADAPAHGEAAAASGDDEPESAQDDSTDAEPAEAAGAEDEPAKDEPAKDEPAKDEPAKDKPAAVKTGPQKRPAKRGRRAKAKTSRAKDEPAAAVAESADERPAKGAPTGGPAKDQPPDVPATAEPPARKPEETAEPPATEPEEVAPAADGRSTVPVEQPPDPGVEGVNVLEPVGSATRSGNGSAGGPGNGDAPPLPEGDAHLERTPDDLSEEIVIAEEDAAAARRAAVRQAR